jgi:hypothetical protein
VPSTSKSTSMVFMPSFYVALATGSWIIDRGAGINRPGCGGRKGTWID